MIGSEQAYIHYLNQCQHSSLTYLCQHARMSYKLSVKNASKPISKFSFGVKCILTHKFPMTGRSHTHTHDALCWVGIVRSNDLLGLWESLLQHTFCCMLQWFRSAYDPFPTSAAPLRPPRSGSAPALLPVHAGSPRPGGQTTTDITWRISNTLQQRRIHSWWHVRL